MDCRKEIGHSGGAGMAEDLNFLEIGTKLSSFKDVGVPPALPKVACSVLEEGNSLSLC